MGSLFEELEAREAAVRARVEELQRQIAELARQLEIGGGSAVAAADHPGCPLMIRDQPNSCASPRRRTSRMRQRMILDRAGIIESADLPRRRISPDGVVKDQLRPLCLASGSGISRPVRAAPVRAAEFEPATP